MSATSFALPGQSLGPVSAKNPGSGTHLQGGHLFSSLAGPVESTASTTKAIKQDTVSVTRSAGPLIPEVGTEVLARITRVGAKQAYIVIVALGAHGEHACRGEGFPAIIRQQDIRATEIDKVKVGESFRVGDVVRAVVISLGDERSYYCGTARNELGVVIANSEWGNQMWPINWKEMQDPITGMTETRKVAKPV